MTLHLPALTGTNPLGFFAALGVLDVATRHLGSNRVGLWWNDDIEPTAQLEGVESVDELIEMIVEDQERWKSSRLFDLDGELLLDLKLETTGDDDQLRRWMEQVHELGESEDIALLHALVAEGATLGSSTESKPTHFHFTAGQQKFMVMVRELRDSASPERFEEALIGPWRFDSPLPMLGWDTSRGDRIYALRGFNPAGDKKLGVPGAEWLGLLGLRFFPVATVSVRGRSQLVTTGCAPGWKKGLFSWPLWGPGPNRSGLSVDMVQSLVADEHLMKTPRHLREAMGVHRILEAPIRRTDQGGYGSFGPPAEQVSDADRVTAMVL